MEYPNVAGGISVHRNNLAPMHAGGQLRPVVHLAVRIRRKIGSARAHDRGTEENRKHHLQIELLQHCMSLRSMNQALSRLTYPAKSRLRGRQSGWAPIALVCRVAGIAGSTIVRHLTHTLQASRAVYGVFYIFIAIRPWHPACSIGNCVGSERSHSYCDRSPRAEEVCGSHA